MTRIPLDQLRVGMYIVGLDKSWMETPFLRHKMWITKESQIQALRDSGVGFVDIDTDKGPGPAAFGGAPASAVASVPKPPAPAPAPPADSFSEELPLAMKAYREAKNVVQHALHAVRLGKAIDTEAVYKVVDGLVDSVLRNEDALTSLSRLKSYDEYTFFHSVNTAVLGITLGRSLDFDRGMLRGLGTGALLHDVGKMKIPLAILNKPDKLKDYEFEIIKQHTLRGAEILAGTTGLEEDTIRPALEHHERVNGTGYPLGKTREKLTLFGLISSVVDVYDAVTSDRVYHKAMQPHEALKLLFSLGQKGNLDAPLVERFIKCIGIYPVGSCVLLNTGETALVQQIRQDRPLRPRLILVRDANGHPIRNGTPLDLAQEGESGHAIAFVLDPRDAGIDPSLFLGRPEF